MSDPDSGDLLLVAARDDAAFQRLLDKWKRPIYTLFERTREPSSASEAACRVFLGLQRTASKYSPATPFAAWIYSLAAQQIQDEPTRPATVIPAKKLLESTAARTAYVRAAIGSLPPSERAAFLIARIGGAPLTVAAQALGVSEDELQRRLVRAMASLRTLLEPASKAVRDFGNIEYYFSPDSAGEPPSDFVVRVLNRAAALDAGKAANKPPSVVMVAGVAAAIVVAGLTILRLVRGSSEGDPRAVPNRRPRASIAEAPPAILKVESTPVSFNAPALPDEEARRVGTLYDKDFLLFLDTLQALDPLFQDEVTLGELAGPIAPHSAVVPSRPHESPEVLADRLEVWRRLSRGERSRIEALDRVYRQRRDDERQILERRWELIAPLSPEEKAGLRRLASRFSSTDPKALVRLKDELRTVGAEPPDRRTPDWRNLGFTRALTGQEAAAGEKVIAAR